MDKIKPYLAVVAKHVFWVGCGLILVVSVLSWYLARGRLHDEFAKNLSDIESKVTSVSQLKNKAQDRENPPKNRYSHKGMDGLIYGQYAKDGKTLVREGVIQKVLEAWSNQYSNQEGILKWPRELGDDFIAAVRPLKPIELKVDYPTPQNQKLDVDYRQRYANYVENLLPRLAQFVGTEWAPGSASGGGVGASGLTTPGARTSAAARKPMLVVWQPQDQSRLLGTHFNWSGQLDSAPTTLQLLYAQEDLWVLEALVRIIAKTNGNIESRHEAVVKTIESIMIGRGVTGRAGQVIRLGAGGMAGGSMAGGDMSGEGADGMYPEEGGYNGYGSEGGASEDMSSDMGEESGSIGGDMGDGMGGGMGASPAGEGGEGGMMSGMSGPGTARLSADPADGRYVDNNYEALRASRIREAMKSGNPDDAFLVVAKRMPIRLRLVVDQRKLHRLLAECGNSPLPVEIRQVRLNRGGGSVGGGGGGYDMGGESGMSGGSGMTPGGGLSLSGAMGLGGDYGAMGESSYPEEGGESGYPSDESSGYPSYGEGGGGMTPSEGNLSGRSQISSTTPHDVPVELYGIIYIYNPVDRDRLGIEQTQEGLTGPVQPETSAAG